jgi:tetratricopeptide (TPR) repeat protein
MYTNLGLALSIADDSNVRAFEAFQNAIASHPTAYTYVTWAAILAKDPKTRVDASKTFEQAHELDPNYEFAYNTEGGILFNEGKDLDASELYEKVIDIKSATSFAKAHAHAMLGRIRARAARGDGSAEEEFGKAVEAEPGYDYAYIAWGEFLSDRQKYAEAARKFERAIELNPDYDYAGVRRGEALAKLGDPKGAVDEFKQVADRNPDYDYAYRAWGGCSIRSAKILRGCREIRRSDETRL